jgi:glyoxylase-like metal-dependent hydrolase (beta-lactamase superfamily II)
VRVVAVHADVIVFVSAFWQTGCIAVRAGDEGFVIDSPVLPEELEALPGVLEQAGFPVSGLLATHADWDHLLGRLAFPHASLGVGESTAARLSVEPGAAQRELRAFDDEHYVERPRPLALAGVQSLPLPGRLSIGSSDQAAELELHPTGGHTADGTAFLAPWAEVLIVGDYLSPVEIPWISGGGSLSEYLETLARFDPLLERATTVVPGHGGPISGDRALELRDEDTAYLEALRDRGVEAPLPAGRRTAEQRRIHTENASATAS